MSRVKDAMEKLPSGGYTKRKGGPRVKGAFDLQKQSVFFRREAVKKRIFEVVKLLAYNDDAVAGGCPDTSKEMHAELDVLSKQLREIDQAGWTIERLEREAAEAAAKIA